MPDTAIIGHGYTQDIIHAKLSSADDEKYVRLATKLLTEVTGRQPTGWVSPRATNPVPIYRPAIWPQLGYKWQCDSLDAELALRFRNSNKEAWSQSPFTVEFNDLSHSMRFGRTPRSVHRHIRGYAGGYSRRHE